MYYIYINTYIYTNYSTREKGGRYEGGKRERLRGVLYDPPLFRPSFSKLLLPCALLRVHSHHKVASVLHRWLSARNYFSNFSQCYKLTDCDTVIRLRLTGLAFRLSIEAKIMNSSFYSNLSS